MLNIFSTILHPIDYLCNASVKDTQEVVEISCIIRYQFLFGVITCILEANPELLRERVHWQEKMWS